MQTSSPTVRLCELRLSDGQRVSLYQNGTRFYTQSDDDSGEEPIILDVEASTAREWYLLAADAGRLFRYWPAAPPKPRRPRPAKPRRKAPERPHAETPVGLGVSFGARRLGPRARQWARVAGALAPAARSVDEASQGLLISVPAVRRALRHLPATLEVQEILDFDLIRYRVLFPAGRVCTAPGCDTILRRSNPTDHCELHGGGYIEAALDDVAAEEQRSSIAAG